LGVHLDSVHFVNYSNSKGRKKKKHFYQILTEPLGLLAGDESQTWFGRYSTMTVVITFK